MATVPPSLEKTRPLMPAVPQRTARMLRQCSAVQHEAPSGEAKLEGGGGGGGGEGGWERVTGIGQVVASIGRTCLVVPGLIILPDSSGRVLSERRMVMLYPLRAEARSILLYLLRTEACGPAVSATG
eukprot:3097534-Rhodomonas_salina.2